MATILNPILAPARPQLASAVRSEFQNRHASACGQEGGFYAFNMKNTSDYRKGAHLNDSESLGLVTDWSKRTG
jgi:hypothetical protein